MRSKKFDLLIGGGFHIFHNVSFLLVTAQAITVKKYW